MTTGQWEPEEALTAGFAAVQTAGVDFGYDERESRPHEVKFPGLHRPLHRISAAHCIAGLAYPV